MKTEAPELEDETADGNYLVIKVPRESARKSIYSYFLTDAPLENFRLGVWIALCGFSLVVGVILEAFFRWKVL
jgi:hypothetical protein